MEASSVASLLAGDPKDLTTCPRSALGSHPPLGLYAVDRRFDSCVCSVVIICCVLVPSNGMTRVEMGSWVALFEWHYSSQSSEGLPEIFSSPHDSCQVLVYLIWEAVHSEVEMTTCFC